jgi:hypothetical protein
MCGLFACMYVHTNMHNHTHAYMYIYTLLPWIQQLQRGRESTAHTQIMTQRVPVHWIHRMYICMYVCMLCTSHCKEEGNQQRAHTRIHMHIQHTHTHTRRYRHGLHLFVEYSSALRTALRVRIARIQSASNRATGRPHITTWHVVKITRRRRMCMCCARRRW